jgi:thioredoxin-related protein
MNNIKATKISKQEFSEIENLSKLGEENYKLLVDNNLLTEEHKGLFLIIDNTTRLYCFGLNQDDAMNRALRHGFKGFLYGKQL